MLSLRQLEHYVALALPCLTCCCFLSWMVCCSQSVLSVQLKPASEKTAAVNTALTVPLRVTGCGLVPQVSVEEVLLTAKKVFEWNVQTTENTPKLTVAYDNQVMAQ